MSVVNKLNSQGGTGLSNFHLKEKPIYLEAMRRYGDNNLVVYSKALEVPDHPHYKPDPYMVSLHYVNAPMPDLSKFWEIWREVVEEFRGRKDV